MAVVSSWGSNEELAAFKAALGTRFAVVREGATTSAEPGEVVEDDILIRADKNPNAAGARALFGERGARRPEGRRPRARLGRGLRLRPSSRRARRSSS